MPKLTNFNLKIKQEMKQVVYRLFGNRYIARARIFRLRHTKILTILNLHRVCDFDCSAYPPLSIDLFRLLLVFLKEFYTIISFADLIACQDQNIEKPFLILSFDDGYYDFYENACPILAEHAVKVNQNIVPWCVDNQRPPLNVALQDFIGKNKDYPKNLTIPGFIFCGNPQVDSLSLSKFIKNRPISEQFAIRKDIQSQGIDLMPFETKMMGINQIKEISSIHEIGSHSFFHSNMSYESDNFFKEDLLRCNNWFLSNLGCLPDIFAFPNSDYTSKQLEILREYGFDHILLVDDDFSRSSEHVHKRFGIDFTNKYSMRFQVTGKFAR